MIETIRFMHRDFELSTALIDCATYREAYGIGYGKPNYPVPAIVRCQWCGSRNEYCDYNKTGIWCPALCFALN